MYHHCSGIACGEDDTAVDRQAREVPTVAVRIREPTAACKSTPASTSSNTGRYDGPRFDAHLTVSELVGGPAGSARSGADLLWFLERDGIGWAIGFYGLSPAALSPQSSVGRANAEIATGARAWVVSLLQPNQHRGEFSGGAFTEDLLRSWLQPQGPYQGIGEIGLYLPQNIGVTLQDPRMQALLRAVDDMKGIVMIHPRLSMQGLPTTAAEIRQVLESYPNLERYHYHRPTWASACAHR